MKKYIYNTVLSLLGVTAFILTCSEPTDELSMNVLPNFIGLALIFLTYKLGEWLNAKGVWNDTKVTKSIKQLPLTSEQRRNLDMLVEELDLEVVEVRRDA